MEQQLIKRDSKGRILKDSVAISEANKTTKSRLETSIRMKNLWLDPEYRANNVSAHKHPNPLHSIRMRKIWERPEYRAKTSVAHAGKKLSEEQKNKMSKSLRTLNIPEDQLKSLYVDKKLSTIAIAKIFQCSIGAIIKRLKRQGTPLRTRSEALTGKIMPEETKLKVSKSKKGKPCSSSTKFRKGFVAPTKWRNMWSETMKKKWTDDVYVRNVMIGRHTKPNNPEKILLALINDNNFPYDYSGDGRHLVGRLCPDFIHKNGERKVIELFGRVYHDPDFTFRKQLPWHQQYWGRLAYYSQLGYKCLIIWDNEMDDEQTVIEKIRSFEK